MAKQAGIHGLRGKVNGMSYYYSKNGGELTRKINEGIGERVKTSAAYANTRKNNAEFGAAGAVAGAIMRTIPQKYRYILKSTATGLLNKEIKQAMMADTTSPWGERALVNGGQFQIQDFFNTLSKNKFPEDLEFAIKENLKFDDGNLVVFSASDVEITDELISELEAMKATHYAIVFYAFKVDAPVFNPDAGEYSTPIAKIEALPNFTIVNAPISDGSILVSEAVQEIDINVQNDDPSQISGVFTVFMPVRKVGTGYNVLQEHCSAAWYGLKTGVQPEP